MAKDGCCGGGNCDTSERETIALAGVPVTVNGEPNAPHASDAEVDSQIQNSEAAQSVAPETFEPTTQEWVEGAAPRA